MTSRRELLSYAIPAAALTTVMAGATLPGIAQAASGGKGMPRARFNKYIELYNANDPGFTQFYDDDVVMETVPPLKGASTIGDFRKVLGTYVNEHITVEFFVSDENGVAAQFLGEFTCVRDMPITALSGLFGKAVKKGQVLRQRGIILYGLKNGKFTFVRAAPPIILQDWS
ncbi:hypothetical protein WSK_2318 [Novosphingobium sp. Rr 2-17]|uniref:hypothetical protein n=1 Tax=Novosphingobium sp. Rr 2-17 TaxID=555793 RepID=UPI0002699ED3|nr:hypothetical protein [Novosphingobium sp. Rr 2-17]EIZ79131.1 hypothetical protein WSK_2318 [Novosphingobium sp. Rr 2-17]